MLKIKRYPPTQNHSLQAWNAGETLAIDYYGKELKGKKLAIYNDRFGYISCTLHEENPLTIISYKSQEKAISLNGKRNNIQCRTKLVLEDLPDKIECALISIPKSIDLFELYLQHVANNSTENIEVLASFMTKHFSKKMLDVAGKYFDSVEQSLAHKKSRLLILKNKKKDFNTNPLIHTIEHQNSSFQQYYGVFSANHIDYASQFLIEHLNIQEEETKVLDLASGNGVLGYFALQQNTKASITLLDDSYLAIESSKLNNAGHDFIWNDDLREWKTGEFDLCISNPPFHFEHENNIEVSLALFQQVADVLKENGRFLMVANKHLNYATHLSKIFSSCEVLKENDKFVIYNCTK